MKQNDDEERSDSFFAFFSLSPSLPLSGVLSFPLLCLSPPAPKSISCFLALARAQGRPQAA